MKLDWMSTSTHSIAESGQWTFEVALSDSLFRAFRTTYDGKERHRIGSTWDAHERDDAIAACEAWLDEHDTPHWYKTDLAACATWRGMGLVVRKSLGSTDQFAACAVTADKQYYTANAYTIDGACEAIEAEIRSATARPSLSPYVTAIANAEKHLAKGD